jgi:hypothetical protein
MTLREAIKDAIRIAPYYDKKGAAVVLYGKTNYSVTPAKRVRLKPIVIVHFPPRPDWPENPTDGDIDLESANILFRLREEGMI